MLLINLFVFVVVVVVVAEVHATENPLTKRPAMDAWFWQDLARKQHQNERKTKMKLNQLEEPQTQKVSEVGLTRLLMINSLTARRVSSLKANDHGKHH